MKWAEERVLCQKTSLSFEHMFSEHLLQIRHRAGPGDDSGDGSGITPPPQGGHFRARDRSGRLPFNSP